MITVRIINVFEGFRHARLRSIWEVVAEYAQTALKLKWFRNTGGWDHAECLNRIWSEEQTDLAGRLVITEHDFLPDLNYDDWLLQMDLDQPDIAVAGACYSKRGGNRQLHNYPEVVGPWFMSFDKTKCPGRLEFRGRVDPAGELTTQLHEAGYDLMLYPGTDPYPLHIGVEYAFGTHLFWSRHYNDPPATRVSGYSVDEILTKHDRCVASWIRQQPQSFQKLLASRLGSSILESSCEYIDARSIFGESSDRCDSSLIEEVPLLPSSSPPTDPPPLS